MVDAAIAHSLAILTRAPSSGGKSRLFSELGCSPDPRLLEALLLDTIAGAAPSGVRVVVAVTPGSACDETRRCLSRLKPAPTTLEPAPATLKPAPATLEPAPAIDVIPQVDGDLGEQMRATMAGLFAQGARAVALIGSDLPHITPAPVIEAFETLARDPEALVLGPAGDGGYYLVAATCVPDVFTGIEWGSGRVLAQTRDAALAQGLRVHLLPKMNDVDTAADLRQVCEGKTPPPRTAEWLRNSSIY